MDWTAYWFMFPVALGIAILATSTGIEGALIFSPVFMLALRLDPRVAIGAAVITQLFGVSSGVIAYMRRRLIDYRLAARLLVTALPLAVLGMWVAGSLSSSALKIAFGVSILGLGLAFGLSPAQGAEPAPIRGGAARVQAEGAVFIGLGGLFMGLVGAGQGGLNNFFLLRRQRLPSAVAIATGNFILAATGLMASLGHVSRFALAGNIVLEQVLSLVLYTVPGVIIGGQIGPRLATHMDTRRLERVLAVVFVVVGLVTLWTAVANAGLP